MYCSQLWRLDVQEHGSSMVGWGPSFWFVAGPFSLCPHMMERARDFCDISCIRALKPFRRAPSHDLITSQRPQLLIPSPVGVKISTGIVAGTQMFRPWHWCTWRDWGKSRELSSGTSGLASIIQKQMPALYIMKPRTLEDPSGVCEGSYPESCWTAWAKLSVVPLLLCFAWFWMCYLHFTDKEGNEGKGLVAGDKGLSQLFF